MVALGVPEKVKVTWSPSQAEVGATDMEAVGVGKTVTVAEPFREAVQPFKLASTRVKIRFVFPIVAFTEKVPAGDRVMDCGPAPSL